MKKAQRRTRNSPSTKEGEERKGTLEEVRGLFDRMSGEATRRSEAEQERARSRSPLARLLLLLTITAFLITVGTGIYGVYKFPDAPIRQTAGGYVGKGGNARAQEDFDAFNLWKSVMFVAFPSAFVLAVAFVIADGKRRRTPKPTQE